MEKLIKNAKNLDQKLINKLYEVIVQQTQKINELERDNKYPYWVIEDHLKYGDTQLFHHFKEISM